jgi:general secretion pathway protein G
LLPIRDTASRQQSRRTKCADNDAIGFFLIVVSSAEIRLNLRGRAPDSCMCSQWLPVQNLHRVRAPVRSGFTLLELVIVILVMAILTTVGALKVFDIASSAKTNGARQSLAVLREAIELYKLQTGAWPGDAGTGADLAADLTPYLKGQFPKLAVPGAPGDAGVAYETDGNGLAAADGNTDWRYDNTDGAIAINVAGYDDY